jgi:2-iminobutanoate/2-iminopropanoate deaminase
MSIDRQTINAQDAPAALGPYSHAVRSGDLLFLSGQIPVDPASGTLIDGDAGDQAARCLQNLELVVGAAGGRLQDAVRCRIYVTDMAFFASVNAAYTEVFSDDPPARSTIEVSALPLGAQVEIEAVVALPPRS